MMMGSIVASAAAAGLGALLASTPVAGSYVTATRFNFWYGSFDRTKDFDTNGVNRAAWDTETKVGALYPSNAETALLDWMNFRNSERPAETRVFAGIMRVPSCRAGVYRFRVRSDDDTDMFVDHKTVLSNPGKHSDGATTQEAVIELKPNTDHQFELWWGNHGGPSELKVEFCLSTAASYQAKQARAEALTSIEGSEPELSDLDLLSHVDDTSCEYTTTLSEIFVKHDQRGFQRCDYEGYFKDVINPDGTVPVPPTDKLMTQFCAIELGGVISMKMGGDLEHDTFVYTGTIRARETGTHTFWLWSDNGSALYVDGVRVVNNPGLHGPQASHGSIVLRAGSDHEIKVYYGNSGKEGVLKVHWTDPLTVAPQEDFTPLLLRSEY